MTSQEYRIEVALHVAKNSDKLSDVKFVEQFTRRGKLEAAFNLLKLNFKLDLFVVTPALEALMKELDMKDIQFISECIHHQDLNRMAQKIKHATAVLEQISFVIMDQQLDALFAEEDAAI
jgi:hypothetical protein